MEVQKTFKEQCEELIKSNNQGSVFICMDASGFTKSVFEGNTTCLAALGSSAQYILTKNLLGELKPTSSIIT